MWLNLQRLTFGGVATRDSPEKTPWFAQRHGGVRVRRGLTDANEVDRLASKAFLAVFQRKQTQHRVLLVWLEKSLAAVRISEPAERCMLESAVTQR